MAPEVSVAIILLRLSSRHHMRPAAKLVPTWPAVFTAAGHSISIDDTGLFDFYFIYEVSSRSLPACSQATPGYGVVR